MSWLVEVLDEWRQSDETDVAQGISFKSNQLAYRTAISKTKGVMLLILMKILSKAESK